MQSVSTPGANAGVDSQRSIDTDTSGTPLGRAAHGVRRAASQAANALLDTDLDQARAPGTPALEGFENYMVLAGVAGYVAAMLSGLGEMVTATTGVGAAAMGAKAFGHFAELQQNQKGLKAQLSQSADQHEQDKGIATRAHFRDLKNSLRSHQEEVLHDLREAQKEADRDQWEMTNDRLQTIITSASVLLAGAGTCIVEGHLPANSIEEVQVAYAASSGLAFGVLLISVVCGMITTNRIADFMTMRARAQRELLASIRRQGEQLQRLVERRRLRKPVGGDGNNNGNGSDTNRGGPELELGLGNSLGRQNGGYEHLDELELDRLVERSNDPLLGPSFDLHEAASELEDVHNFANHRQKLNEIIHRRFAVWVGRHDDQTYLNFEKYYEQNCGFLRRVGVDMCFLIGTVSLLVSLALNVWAHLNDQEEPDTAPGAICFVTVTVLCGVAAVAIFVADKAFCMKSPCVKRFTWIRNGSCIGLPIVNTFVESDGAQFAIDDAVALLDHVFYAMDTHDRGGNHAQCACDPSSTETNFGQSLRPENKCVGTNELQRPRQGTSDEAHFELEDSRLPPITFRQWVVETQLQLDMEESGSSRSKLMLRDDDADESMRATGMKRLRCLKARIYAADDTPETRRNVELFIYRATFQLFLGRDSKSTLSFSEAREALSHIIDYDIGAKDLIRALCVESSQDEGELSSKSLRIDETLFRKLIDNLGSRMLHSPLLLSPRSRPPHRPLDDEEKLSPRSPLARRPSDEEELYGYMNLKLEAKEVSRFFSSARSLRHGEEAEHCPTKLLRLRRRSFDAGWVIGLRKRMKRGRPGGACWRIASTAEEPPLENHEAGRVWQRNEGFRWHDVPDVALRRKDRLALEFLPNGRMGPHGKCLTRYVPYRTEHGEPMIVNRRQVFIAENEYGAREERFLYYAVAAEDEEALRRVARRVFTEVLHEAWGPKHAVRVRKWLLSEGGREM